MLYDHVSTMWYYEGWLPEASVEDGRSHYAAYKVKHPDVLCIISLCVRRSRSRYLVPDPLLTPANHNRGIRRSVSPAAVR
jgi:hypothetical protein